MPTSPSRRAPIAFALTGILLAGCAAAGLGALAGTAGVALDVLRKAFGGVAASNYGESYREDADKLFHVMAKTPEGGTAPAPGTPPAGGTPPPAGTPTDPAAAAAAAAAGGAPPPGGAPPAPGGVPAAPPVAVGPLALEVSLLKEEIIDNRSIQTPVQDGEVLYDGYGTHGKGDNIKFMFRANENAYVYVISIDSTSWIQPVFPSSYAGFTNPVVAHKTYLFPEGNLWLPLDSYRGNEHLFFIASRTPRPDLEQALVACAAHVRELNPNRAQEGEALAYVPVSEGATISRGLGTAPRASVVPGVPTSTGETITAESQIFAASGPGDVLVTRWFRHQ